jgi:hypothetical protein
MMFRRVVSLVLTVQLLLTQLMACHCHAAAGHASCGGSTPHIHLSSLPGGKAAGGHGHSHHGHSHSHGHSHGHDHDPADEGTDPGGDERTGEQPCGQHRHGHGSDAYNLPDGWHAERPTVRLAGGTFVFAFVLPDPPDLSRLLAGVGQASGVPPDPEPPGLPVYLRTLRLLV